MNIRQLECFNAVIRNGTMTKAAEVVGISQPAISNMIASLEYEIGFKLFTRDGTRLHLTPEGEYLLDDVERTLGSFERTRRIAKAINNQTIGRLVVASYPGISMHFLPRIVAEYLAERPDVHIELHARSSEILHEILLTQRYDIAIVDLPITYPGAKVEPITLECKCVMPNDHPLAKRHVIRPQDLIGVPMISLFREHALTHQIDKILAAANVEWNFVVETRFFESACALVTHGTGLTIADSITASEHLEHGLIAIPFEPPITHTIGLVYPPKSRRPALLETFVALLKMRFAPLVMQAIEEPRTY